MRKHEGYWRVGLGCLGLILTFGVIEVIAEERSIVDRFLLDPAIRRAGFDPSTPEAEAAKRLGKDWLNPFASNEEIQADIAHIRSLVTGRESEVGSIYHNDRLSPTEKKAAFVRLLGNVKDCSLCGRQFPLDYSYCPLDASRLSLAVKFAARGVGTIAIWNSGFGTRGGSPLMGCAVEAGIRISRVNKEKALDEISSGKLRGIYVGESSADDERVVHAAIRCAQQGARVFIEANSTESRLNDLLQDLIGARIAEDSGTRRELEHRDTPLQIWAGLRVAPDRPYYFQRALFLDRNWTHRSKVVNETISGWRRSGKGEIVICSVMKMNYNVGSDYLMDFPALYDNKAAFTRLLGWLSGEFEYGGKG